MMCQFDRCPLSRELSSERIRISNGAVQWPSSAFPSWRTMHNCNALSRPEYYAAVHQLTERFKKGLFIRSFLGTVKKRVLGMLDARGNAMLVFRHFHKSAWKSTRLRLAPTTFRHPSTPWSRRSRESRDWLWWWWFKYLAIYSNDMRMIIGKKKDGKVIDIIYMKKLCTA